MVLKGSERKGDKGNGGKERMEIERREREIGKVREQRNGVGRQNTKRKM